jgi:uncharacterized protein YndB with AHSA1/START domain
MAGQLARVRIKEAAMPYSLTLTSRIPASAQEICDAWLDSLGHSEMTGGAARMSDVLGAEVSAWNGYISGRNLELVPPRRIVQSWRTTMFTGRHEDSIITVALEEEGDETLLTLVHSNVPDDQKSYEQGGWQSNYFEPMRGYFGARRRKRAAKASPGRRKAERPAAAKPKTKRAKPGRTRSAKGKRAKSTRATARSGRRKR